MTGFETRRAQWQADRSTPWGRIREAVVAHTLAGLTGEASGWRILDVGGGDGQDAIPLAAAGHSVTIADPSATLLRDATEAAAARGCEVTTVRTDIAALDTVPGFGEFDLVLCHDVLPYVDDVRRSIGRVVAAAGPACLVSLLCPNPAAEVLAAMTRGADPDDALRLLDASTRHSDTFDRPTHRIDVGTAERGLVGSGCELLHMYGIRCVTDLVAGDDHAADPGWFDRLLRLELALCDREPHLRVGRFFQLVGRTF